MTVGTAAAVVALETAAESLGVQAALSDIAGIETFVDPEPELVELARHCLRCQQSRHRYFQSHCLEQMLLYHC